MFTLGFYAILMLARQCSTAGVLAPCATVAVDVEVAETLSPEERLQNALALHQAEHVEPVKMGYSLSLDQPAEPLRVVSSDGPAAGEGKPLKVRLAQFTPTPGGPGCLGVCLSFSSQGAEGLRASTGKRIKGVQLVVAQVCADRPATVGAGKILTEAGMVGYQWHLPAIGEAIINRTVNLNWRTVIVNTVKYGTMFVLDLAIPGSIHLSLTTKAILAAVHTSADELPFLFAPGAPDPAPYLKALIDPNETLSVAPDRCVIRTFSAVYPGGPKTTGAIQLIP